MASLLLDGTSKAICPHGGDALPAGLAPRVRLSGSPAVLQQPPWPVIGCPMPPLFGAGPTGQMHTIIGMLPCFLVKWVTATVRVKSMGQPLLLATSRSVILPNGQAAVPLAGQARVSAV